MRNLYVVVVACAVVSCGEEPDIASQVFIFDQSVEEDLRPCMIDAWKGMQPMTTELFGDVSVENIFVQRKVLSGKNGSTLCSKSGAPFAVTIGSHLSRQDAILTWVHELTHVVIAASGGTCANVSHLIYEDVFRATEQIAARVTCAH